MAVTMKFGVVPAYKGGWFSPTSQPDTGYEAKIVYAGMDDTGAMATLTIGWTESGEWVVAEPLGEYRVLAWWNPGPNNLLPNLNAANEASAAVDTQLTDASWWECFMIDLDEWHGK